MSADDDALAAVWAHAVLSDAREWRSGEPCPLCSEWIGHFNGCPCIPDDVPLKEVRPNCYRVRALRPSIAGAVRAMERRA